MTIITIIVTYNAMQWIDRCIGSLQDSSVPTEVVVVDNASSDGTADYIRKYFPDVQLFAQDTNLGFGQANNIGLRYALQKKADYVLLLNQDAWIEKDMLEKLLRHNDVHSLLSPVHLRGDGMAIDKMFLKNSILKSDINPDILANDPLLSKDTEAHATNEINAACWLMPKQMLQDIGGFNPLFFHYAEDTNYLQRLRFHGYSIRLVGSTYVFHDRPQQEAFPVSSQRIYQDIILRRCDITRTPLQRKWAPWRYFMGICHTCLTTHEWKPAKWFLKEIKQASRIQSQIDNSIRQESVKQTSWL